MSRASKIFFASSIFLAGGTIYGVHYLQKRESNTMYQGVIRDEARVLAKAASKLTAALPTLPSLPAIPSLSPPPPDHPLAHQHSSTTPLNTPSSPVQQPLSVIDEDCETCRISPPAELVEKQSKEERRRERELRRVEYEEQRVLGEKLEKEQGVKEGDRQT